MRGGNLRAATLSGAPIVFIDVHVGGRDLAEVGGGDVDKSEALFEKGVLDFTDGEGLRYRRPAACVTFSVKRTAMRFAVGGPVVRRADLLRS